jgi:protein-disulfide isomerase
MREYITIIGRTRPQQILGEFLMNRSVNVLTNTTSKVAPKLVLGVFMILTLFGTLLAHAPNAGAQEQQQPAPAQADEESVERMAREMIRQLLDEGILDERIELGIQRYIEKQQRARKDAAAESQAQALAKASSVRRVSAERDHIYGNVNAPVSLIEYSDFECPFCKSFHPTAKRLIDNSNGEVNWVYRHYPLAFHNPLAQQEAEASECAGALGGNEAFWRYADLLYERTRSNGKGLSVEALVPFAGEIGLDEADFRACFESGRFSSRVLEDFEEGMQIGITGTPGNIILNNKTGKAVPAPGALPYERMRKIIDGVRDPTP